MANFQPVTATILNQLAAIVGAENLSTALAERELRSKDMSGHLPHLSEVVVWPTNAQQVAAVLGLANEALIPVTPWGAGSSLEGNPIPLYGGILLSTERMAAIVAVHADDFQVTVQPGIGYKDLNAQLARYGLFFPPDPGANATIGGMLANNAAGIRTVRYGASRDNVLEIQVAMADGRLIKAGSRSIKQSAGYDLCHLIVGSEGTLGVITEATLKLAPIAEMMSAVVATFPDVQTAVAAVVTVRGSGLNPAALEFIDAATCEILTRADKLEFGANPTLFMEFHTTHKESLEKGLELATEICTELGATRVQATADPAIRKRLWQARHHMFETLVRLYPGERWMLMDVAVPISHYPEIVTHTANMITQLGSPGFMVGHAGDGNLHVAMPFADEEIYERAKALNKSVVQKAISLRGTSTGEHGVGIGKAVYMRAEHGAALDVMYAIKQALDPNGILNPGKIFPQS